MTPLAVDTDARSPLLPDVPTLREIGYKGPLTQAYFGLVAPAGTPKPIIAKLHDIVVEIAGDKAFAERNMINLGLLPILDTPEQFAAFLEGKSADRRAHREGIRARAAVNSAGRRTTPFSSFLAVPFSAACRNAAPRSCDAGSPRLPS